MIPAARRAEMNALLSAPVPFTDLPKAEILPVHRVAIRAVKIHRGALREALAEVDRMTAEVELGGEALALLHG